jgi:hypothetical protein
METRLLKMIRESPRMVDQYTQTVDDQDETPRVRGRQVKTSRHVVGEAMEVERILSQETSDLKSIAEEPYTGSSKTTTLGQRVAKPPVPSPMNVHVTPRPSATSKGSVRNAPQRAQASVPLTLGDKMAAAGPIAPERSARLPPVATSLVNACGAAHSLNIKDIRLMDVCVAGHPQTIVTHPTTSLPATLETKARTPWSWRQRYKCRSPSWNASSMKLRPRRTLRAVVIIAEDGCLALTGDYHQRCVGAVGGTKKLCFALLYCVSFCRVTLTM